MKNYLYPLLIIFLVIGSVVWMSHKPSSLVSQEEKLESLSIISPSPNMENLKIEDLQVGAGPEVKSGDVISIHYTGTLLDGAKFDSSYDRGQPFETQIGVGRVIQGWDMGVVGMKVGGKRRLTIPPELGYGDRGAGNVIPPKATLVFEVELMGIK